MRHVPGPAVLVALALVAAGPATATSAAPVLAGSPFAHTYSIVARDPVTGDFGVAVQSHWFQVGTVVAWAEAGVGAVATQSIVNVAFGPQGLAKLAAGTSAEATLQELLASDKESAYRQVGIVDREGRVAAWTGARCIAAAGHQTGAGSKGYSVQANLMAKPTVWPAMAKAYEAATGDLADRMLAALEAAEAEGGDIRGRQSAALVVVRAQKTAEPWTDRLVDLRVDDHPQPLAELRRLLRLHRAYTAMNAGDTAFAQGRIEDALKLYAEGTALAPDIVELPFWKAVTLFTAGREAEALPIFRDVFAREARWVELVPRLVASGMLPDDAARLERILAVAPAGAPR